jgi:Holliday junction resolvase RusA-like endonuclease
MDAFNGVVWLDDSQIVSITALKQYTDQEPHMKFSVEEIFSADENNHKKTTIKGKGVKQ